MESICNVFQLHIKNNQGSQTKFPQSRCINNFICQECVLVESDIFMAKNVLLQPDNKDLTRTKTLDDIFVVIEIGVKDEEVQNHNKLK